MASAIAHGLVGAAVGFATVAAWRAPVPAGDDELAAQLIWARHDWLSARLPIYAAVVSVLPDADVLMHAFVQYSDPFGHRGAFHSLAFYLCVAALVARLPVFVDRRRSVFACLFVSMASHSLLDMLTNGGYGVGLLWPVTDARLFWPWRPLPVSPLTLGGFLGARGLRILAYELPIALPLFVAGLVAYRRREILAPESGTSD